MFYGLILLIVGILSAVSIVTKLVKESEKLINILVPFQGFIGVGAFIWGIWNTIYLIIRLGWLFRYPLWWITHLACSALLLVLGFILGFGLISKYALSKNEEAKKKGEEILAKLAGYQSLLGIIAICVGIWYILYELIISKIIYAVS